MEALTAKTVVTARLRADGPTKVLEFTEDLGLAGTEVTYDVDTDLGDVDEFSEDSLPSVQVTRSFSFRVDAFGISLINSRRQELLYASFRVCVLCEELR